MDAAPRRPYLLSHNVTKVDRAMKLLRGLWALLVGIKDALVLIAMLLFFGTLAFALSMKPNSALPSSGALVLDLAGSLVEQPAETDTLSLLSGGNSLVRETRLRDVERALAAASRSTSVKAVVLDLDGFLGAEPATLAAAAAAIDKVRAGGKPVFAYATAYADDGYRLAAHATEIWLDPLGAVALAGPGGSQPYYKGLMDKLGITAKIYRVGTYKAAVEPFMRNDQSPEAREASQALYGAIWAEWQADVRKARPKARIADYITRPTALIGASQGRMSQAALDNGLVDKLGDRNAFRSRITAIAGEDTGNQPNGFKTIDFDRWTSANPEKSSGTPIGVLTIAGEIVDGYAPPGTAGGTTIAELLEEELARKRIKALVLRVDSPGGSVTGADRIRSAVLEAKAMGLPVVVSMGGLAASGGYWISTPADRIIADRSTITGSIGVFGIIPTFQGSLEKLGIGADGVKTTPLSGEPDVLRGTSPQFDAMVQGSIEDIYGRFVGLVAQSRKMTPERVNEIAQGRVWSGVAARQIGLVDAFGNVDAASAAAARRAKLDPATVRPVYIEEPLSPWRQMLRDFAAPEESREARVSTDPWAVILGRPERQMLQAVGTAKSLLTGPSMQVRCLECQTLSAAPRAREIGDARSLLAWLLR